MSFERRHTRSSFGTGADLPHDEALGRRASRREIAAGRGIFTTRADRASAGRFTRAARVKALRRSPTAEITIDSPRLASQRIQGKALPTKTWLSPDWALLGVNRRQLATSTTRRRADSTDSSPAIAAHASSRRINRHRRRHGEKYLRRGGSAPQDFQHARALPRRHCVGLIASH